MPSTQVALLRGINVGRNKRIAMADLRKLCEKLGYRDVRTLLNSGNVVFTNPRGSAESAAARIEEALVEGVGVAARVTVLTAAEVQAIVDSNPLLAVANDPTRLMVAVLRSPADRQKVEALARLDWGADQVALGPRVVYVWCPGGILESKAFEALAKALGDGVTTRNWATVLKIQAMMASTGAG